MLRNSRIILIYTYNYLKCIHQPTTLNRLLLREHLCINNVCSAYTAVVRQLSTNTTQNMSCWNCKYSYVVRKHGAVQFFCPECKVVQAPQGTMTYFDILNCEENFDLEPKVLTDKFRKLQSKLHPDKYTMKSETEQNYSSLLSSVVNEAYQTLLKPLSRGLYLLSLNDVAIEDGNITIDVEFLSEIMEMNETLATGSKPELTKLKNTNQENINQCLAKAKNAFKNNDLLTAREVISKMKYFDNINEQIKEKMME